MMIFGRGFSSRSPSPLDVIPFRRVSVKRIKTWLKYHLFKLGRELDLKLKYFL
jgi:hypothetical protein